MIDVTPYLNEIGNKPIAVLGLGLSGISTIKAFKKAGATKIYGWDDREEGRKNGQKAGAEITEFSKDTLEKCGALIVSPGVPLHHPQPHVAVKIANELSLEITGDIEIFYRCVSDRKIVALTGTNGKSTTTSLIHHILQENKVKSAMAGNIGLPVLSAKLPAKGGVVVLELSSYQLDLCSKFAPDIGILLNITPDHIDRHGSVEQYAATKARVFNDNSIASIVSTDDEHTEKLCSTLKSDTKRNVLCVSVNNHEDADIIVKGGTLFDLSDDDNTEELKEIGSLNNITMLHGPHNKQNAACAYAATKALGLEDDKILDAMKTFAGLPHRQFPVRVMNGVAYINDSKATNAEAAGKALGCNSNIYWIVGGIAKEGGLSGLQVFKDNIKHAFLIGEAAEDFSNWLMQYGIEYTKSGTLDIAVTQAHKMAQDNRGQPGGAGVVLLSPACASFDQFKSFEHRGDVFTDLVKALEDGESST